MVVFMTGGGSTASFPIKASDLEIGESVYLTVDGVETEFIVVHQGNPTSDITIYDDSCDGTWLLMKDIYIKMAMTTSSTASNKYAESDVHTYLNEDFYSLLDANAQNSIKDVVIPYCESTSSTMQGSRGLDTKVFLLACYELGLTSDDYTYIMDDGSKLDYFLSGTGTEAKNLRIAFYDGSTIAYRTRTARESNTYYMHITAAGTYGSATYTSTTYGIRPAMVLDFDTKFDPDTKLCLGV